MPVLLLVSLVVVAVPSVYLAAFGIDFRQLVRNDNLLHMHNYPHIYIYNIYV